ncbi:DUF3216 domain-containing protein [Thermococci archaeon]|nr:MAG: DUF3216 domain-containing protein [Thermococci archaeon]
MESIVERVKSLCEEHGEMEALKKIDSFIALNRAIEPKKGRDYVELGIYGFLEGILTTLRIKVKDEEGRKKIEELLSEVKTRRKELDEKFKKSGENL